MLGQVISRSALLAGAAAGTYLAVRPWHTRWGATDDEVTMPLPGDDFVPVPRQQATRAITIHAPPEDVWAWLVQIGHGRGGFFSYDVLENVIGADIHTADRIVPKLQRLQAGDLIRLAPDPGPAMYVATVEPARVLVLYAGMNMTENRMYAPEEPLPADYSVATWVFVLEPIENVGTRLIVRFRLDWSPSIANFIIWRVMTEPAHFIMERKMLLTLKERAERIATPPSETLLDRYLPAYDVGFRVETIVDATPEETFAAAKNVDRLMQTDPAVLALSEVRLLPERILRRLSGNEAPTSVTPPPDTAEQMPPFVQLDEDPGQEYVVGLIGQFWQPDAGMLPFEPEEFATFERPGFAKMAFNFTVQSIGPNRTLLISETRTAATDDEARTQFRRYWRLIGPGAQLIMRRLLARIKESAEAQHHTTPAI